MTLHFICYGPLRPLVSGPLTLEVAAPATPTSVKPQLIAQLTALGLSDAGLVERSAFATDDSIIGEHTALVDGATYAVLPPVSGG